MQNDYEIASQNGIRSIQDIAAAGFLILLTGNIMRMPGLPGRPMAEQIELLPDGSVFGVG